MKVRNIPPQPQWGGHVSSASYALGYILSLLFTFIAFFIVGKKLLSGAPLAIAIFGLAAVQVAIQLRCYLNFGKESTPRWNYWAFFFMLILLLIVFVGSLIIMANLDYRMMND